jgi:hypothetical protein
MFIVALSTIARNGGKQHKCLFINDEHTCSGKLFSLKKEENTD